MAASDVRIGVLRGRENSFPDAFIAKVNSMGKGVTAEYIQLGGTKLNEPVPYRVILDRMSHEVPYYSVYLKMAALQGTYCINNTFWRTRRRQVLRLRGRREAGHRGAEDGGAAQPRATWTTSPRRACATCGRPTSRCTLDYVGLPCIMKPAFGGGWKDVNKIHNLEELRAPLRRLGHEDDDAAGVHHLGHLHPRAHHRPALGARDPLRPRAHGHGRLQPGLRHPAARACATRRRSCRCASTRRWATT